MTLEIRLLGRPSLRRGGEPARAPRGKKAWALLGYLVLRERPVPRRELAELLFAEADDPLGALRWSISQLRRALQPDADLGGDPLALSLGSAVEVDAASLLAGARVSEEDVDRITDQLLDGIRVDGAPAFETWLAVERRRLAAAAEDALRELALVRLAAGEHEAAVEMARRAATLNPLDEDSQELLVRCLAAGGDRAAALAQVEACEALFREELGVDPSPAVRRAADYPDPVRSAAGRPAAVRGLLEAGRAAITAGAIEAGITSLREASAEAARCRDAKLRAETLCALGIALVHAVRGWDGEGAASLHRALLLAEEAGDDTIAATAHRELGWIGAVSGRGEQANAHLAEARALAKGDGEIAAILGVQGLRASDVADYPRAEELLHDSLGRADAAGDRRQRVFSGTILSRVHLLRGELDDAERVADEAVAEAKAIGWLAYQPFPETTGAEVARRRGDLDSAEEKFDHAFALGCQLGDPCWEAFAARGLGLVTNARGDTSGAGRWLEEARTRCVRWPDRYAWALAWVLDAEAGVAIERGDPTASGLAGQMEEVATRAGLRELIVRSLLHRARLGEAEAAAGAHLLAREIDSPLLDAELDQAEAAPQTSA